MTQIKAHLLGAQACISAAIDNLDEAEPRKGTIAALQERALSYRRAAEHANQATAEMREQLLRSQVGNERLREEAGEHIACIAQLREWNYAQAETINKLRGRSEQRTPEEIKTYVREAQDAINKIVSKWESK